MVGFIMSGANSKCRQRRFSEENTSNFHITLVVIVLFYFDFACAQLKLSEHFKVLAESLLMNKN